MASRDVCAQANQKSDTIIAALRAQGFSSSPDTESHETTQSHDENNNRGENDESIQKDVDGCIPAPFRARRLDNETSAEESATADDSARNCAASSTFSEEASYEEGRERPSHDAVSLPLPVRFDPDSCHRSD